VITTFDGDLETYLDAFVNEIGEVFDELLSHMQGSPPLPVKKNRDAFRDYVIKNDKASVGGLYSGYPGLSVQDIRQLAEQAKANSAPAP
jgi:hypothetical protein